MLGFCADIALGMNYLEDRGLVHGHLSPKCCLITESEQVKVSSARGVNHHAQLRYSAPEAIVLVSFFGFVLSNF
jgi:serine/threonine protein kinase